MRTLTSFFVLSLTFVGGCDQLIERYVGEHTLPAPVPITQLTASTPAPAPPNWPLYCDELDANATPGALACCIPRPKAGSNDR